MLVTKKELFSTAEAAEYLGLAEVTVKYHLREGNLPGQKVGRNMVFLRSDLDAFKSRGVGRPSRVIPKVKSALALSGVKAEMVTKRKRFVHFVREVNGEKRIIRLPQPPSQMTVNQMAAAILRAVADE